MSAAFGRAASDINRVDKALAALGLTCQVAITVSGYTAALGIILVSDLVASVPEQHTGSLRAGLFSFALPLAMPEITVSLLWHPRMDGHAAHRRPRIRNGNLRGAARALRRIRRDRMNPSSRRNAP